MPNGKPNILIIWGDDIGITNLSCYSDGLMGYRTPNIDRIANEGMRFTDSYGEQSCTAGRAAFLTGQNPYRTGLTKVGMPGADIGLQAEDATIAELLKPLGYATGQFGKNHLGDQEQVPAHRPRLRRVLRQPLPPQRRGGAGDRDYPPEGPQLQEASSGRAA
jgi:arylsulfatase A-like enzyme